MLLDRLASNNEHRVRQRAVHNLATALHADDVQVKQYLHANTPFPALVEIATEAEARSDALTLSLVFSAIANLATALIPLCGTGGDIGRLLGRSLLMATTYSSVDDEVSLLSSSLSAAYNLSGDMTVLTALNDVAVAPALIKLMHSSNSKIAE